METEVLGRAMRESTAELQPPPDFTARVVRRGRRRQVNRRICLAAGLAVMAALAGVPAVGGLPGTTEVSADPRLAEPTRGDLAGDRQFLATAVRAWRAGMPVSFNASRGLFDDLRGDAHVYWAGTTPAGRAAVVLQQAYLHPHGDLSPEDANQMQTLVGLVAIDPKDGALKLVTDQYRADGFPEPGYFLFGPGDRTVLVVDRGRPLYFSSAPVTSPGGKVARYWRPMSIVDGVAVAQLPPGAVATDARVLVRDRRPAPDDRSSDGLLYLEPASQYLDVVEKNRRGEDYIFGATSGEHRLQWTQPDGPVLLGPSPYRPADWRATFRAGLEEYGMLDMGVRTEADGLWCVLAGLPDGRTAMVSDLERDEHPSRLYAVLMSRTGKVQTVLAGGVVDRAAVLPVALRMPDAQGWVVASYGSHLRYRTSTGGAWLDGGDNAALLPDAATEVQVTRPGKEPGVVALRR
jgi:hypothetical protein